MRNVSNAIVSTCPSTGWWDRQTKNNQDASYGLSSQHWKILTLDCLIKDCTSYIHANIVTTYTLWCDSWSGVFVCMNVWISESVCTFIFMHTVYHHHPHPPILGLSKAVALKQIWLHFRLEQQRGVYCRSELCTALPPQCHPSLPLFLWPWGLYKRKLH